MAELPLSGKSRTQILRWQRQCWVAGLRWEEKQKSVRRSPAQRQRHGVLNVALTVKQGKSRLTALGQVEGGWRHQKLYSLAALFSQLCTPNGYGVYQLDNGQQVFLATVNGMPSLMADVVGTPEQIARAQELFLSFNPAPAKGWHILSSAETPESWEVLVQAATAAQLRMVRLSGESNRRRGVLVGGLIIVLSGGFFWWNLSPETPTGPTPAEIQAQARAIIMKPPEPVYLPHPWASMPDPTEFLTRCLRFRAAVPVSLDRWRLDRAHCGAEGLEVVYLRQPGGTTARFAERVRQVFNRIPVFNLVSGGNEGVVFVPWDGFTFRDETVPDAGAQLMQAVSWFQSRQVSFSLSEVKDPPVMPGESAGNDAPQPIKDWHEYTFSITDKHMPEWILQGLNMRGVRLSSVAYTLSPQGQFTYQIEGHLYAKK
ncbi:type 4b pilus protein PilO2 [Salmonella enterica]|uniref:Pilus assembly protein n=2 Tax=Salmonella enterica TaxID=28901 RepID=A0A6C7C9P8_SALER|nr:type 4b pilus protein PilO2 [Salmonella enterica]ECC1658008.1 pilus assembly protein [Salmonella enterica subsp. salamae]ASG86813.1 pilus assembly protein [Salmonella enterica subsp. salamae serovar 55:k:z39 str. 1315K]ECD9415884.1 pilus assembly protein [Salmonella enterica subsp. salamae]ECF5932742.1 pilus assembly protein [Salmonella enterica subsp. salamae]ECG1251654.1 pilus assembly protein [Salmonella enterica subsp. salamae]